MNIFAVHFDPRVAAMELPDKLVSKMIQESALMLSTAHRILDGDAYANKEGFYRKAYENHPCTVWARADALNYYWLWLHAYSLIKEYEWRFHKAEHKQHASEPLICKLKELPTNIPQVKTSSNQVLADLPLCMPEEYKSFKHENTDSFYQKAYDVTYAYQKYITRGKSYMEDVFKAYKNPIDTNEYHRNKGNYVLMTKREFPPMWVVSFASKEQKKHIDLHKLMMPA